MTESEKEWEALQQASCGDQVRMERLLQEHRPRLQRMVGLRLDGRVRGRVDPSDVIQDAYLEAYRRLNEYLENPSVPFFIWLRFLTGQKLRQVHRQHLGVEARAVSREVANYRSRPEASSAAIVAQLAGKLTSPSAGAAKAEAKSHLQEALDSMNALDREVLVLRHFEQLTYAEAASELEMSESAVAKRYIRALAKLRTAFGGPPERSV